MAVPPPSTATPKALLAHLTAACDHVEHLSVAFRRGIERLEAATLAHLSVASVRQWFTMYLRLVDLGVELRRGELRHRSTPTQAYPCMHSTGTKGALHSGLSIDDANAIYSRLDTQHRVRESVLEACFIRMDGLDRDTIGPLDARLHACLDALLHESSAFYRRLEVTGIDPHQELLIVPNEAGDGRVVRATRRCFSPATCTCDSDAEPWNDFKLTAGRAPPRTTMNSSPSTTAAPTDAGSNAATAAATGEQNASAEDEDDAEYDIGLDALKRQFGFSSSTAAQVDGDDGRTDTTTSVKRRRVAITTDGSIANREDALRTSRLSPQEIYHRKCQERGTPHKRRVEKLFVVSDGALELDLSLFGFHEAQDLEDILEVVKEANLPIRAVNATNNFFDAKSFELFCDLLRLPMLRHHVQSLNFRCMALPQRPDFAALLRVLSDADGGTLDALRFLDLSYNTFFEDAVLCLNDLLDGLMKIETLSLESCFPKAPDPAVAEVAVVKDLVRAALTTCCHRLRCLNFSSNWMSFALLNSLFSADSALQELILHEMTFFFMESPDAIGSTWGFTFQHQRILKLSETKDSGADFLPFFMDALNLGLASGTSQLQHLDLSILSPQHRKKETALLDQQLDDRFHALLVAAAENGGLSTVRIRYDCRPLCAQCVAAITQLFRQGLGGCQLLDLSVSLPLSWDGVWRLLAELRAPRLKTLKLSVLLLQYVENANGGLPGYEANRPMRAEQVFQSVFGTLTDVTLELKVDPSATKVLVPDAIVKSLETAWVSLPSWQTTRQMIVTRRTARKERLRDQDDRMHTRNLVTLSFQFTTGM